MSSFSTVRNPTKVSAQGLGCSHRENWQNQTSLFKLVVAAILGQDVTVGMGLY